MEGAARENITQENSDGKLVFDGHNLKGFAERLEGMIRRWKMSEDS